MDFPLIEASWFWQILSIGYSIFCFWMLFSCIFHEDNRDHCITWTMILLISGGIAAPFYYWLRYRPLRAARKQAEADDERRLKELLADVKRRSST